MKEPAYHQEIQTYYLRALAQKAARLLSDGEVQNAQAVLQEAINLQQEPVLLPMNLDGWSTIQRKLFRLVSSKEWKSFEYRLVEERLTDHGAPPIFGLSWCGSICNLYDPREIYALLMAKEKTKWTHEGERFCILRKPVLFSHPDPDLLEEVTPTELFQWLITELPLQAYQDAVKQVEFAITEYWLAGLGENPLLPKKRLEELRKRACKELKEAKDFKKMEETHGSRSN